MNASIMGMNYTTGERDLAAAIHPLTTADRADILRNSIKVQREWLALYTKMGNTSAATSVRALIGKLQAQLDYLEPKPETHSKGATK